MSGATRALTAHAPAGQGRPRSALARDDGSTQAKRLVVAYGFWLFLISDIILFAALFAAYAVLSGATAGGPAGRDLFDLRMVAIETACLLASTFACGVAGIGARQRDAWLFHGGMAATFLLGTAFVVLEWAEFARMLQAGAGPQRSAFLSAFFALIGCHGLHVAAGLLWSLTMMAQAVAKGLRADVRRRVLCFGLFWHTLDIVWVALFSLVYLVGVAS